MNFLLIFPSNSQWVRKSKKVQQKIKKGATKKLVKPNTVKIALICLHNPVFYDGNVFENEM